MAGTWQMGAVTATDVWEMGAEGEVSTSISITGVGSGGTITDGQTGILVSGEELDTVTTAIVETSTGTYQEDVTASYSASSATEATFDHTRGDTPLSTSGYQLRLSLSDGVETATFDITVNPSAGEQVTELAGTVVITDPESAFAPYTGSDPVVGDQYIVPDTTAEGAVITANADSTLEYDYTGIDPVPETDSHAVEWWSDDGSGRVWSSGTINIDEPVEPPAGTITFGTITVTDTTADIPFSYDAADEDSFEYSLEGEAWVTTTSPISLTELDPETLYNIEVRAVNAGGESTVASTSFTTEEEPTAPSGNIDIGGMLITQTEATIPFTYNEDDADSFEHSIDAGETWNAVTSPIERTGLSANTQYSGIVRAVNALGTSSETFYEFRTLTPGAGIEARGIKRSIKDYI